jgi:replicative DNA helicase
MADDPMSGAVPPHSLEAEKSVLGAMLLGPETQYEYVIKEQLRPEDFYSGRHRMIFAAMAELFADSEPIDVLTVTEQLRRTGKLDEVGGGAEIDMLTAVVPVVSNVRAYASMVREKAMLRRVLAASYEIQASVHTSDAPPKEIVEQAEKTILEVGRDDAKKDFKALGSVVEFELKRWDDLSSGNAPSGGVATGFEDLDQVTGGLHPGALIIVAARPGMGKSAWVTSLADNIALSGTDPRPVALFSLEMAEAELAQRFMANKAGIKLDDLRLGRLKDERKWKKVYDAANAFDKAPLYVDDSSDVGLMDVRAKCRRLHQTLISDGWEQGLGLVVVDYLQLMRTDQRVENRVQAIGELSRGLKILARELELPVIALSQLSRAVESRTDKRPMLSDLRESGSLEQDADIVAFIYRDEYYNENSDAIGEAEFIVAKHRQGPTDTVRLAFQGEFARFRSLAVAA